MWFCVIFGEPFSKQGRINIEKEGIPQPEKLTVVTSSGLELHRRGKGTCRKVYLQRGHLQASVSQQVMALESPLKPHDHFTD